MPNSNPPYALWSIWIYLPLLPKLVLLILCTVGIYSIFSATVILARLRAMTSLGRKEDVPSIQRALAELNKKCTNMQQLIGGAFYFFGFVLFLSLQWAYFTIDKSSTPGGWRVLENFAVYFAFAANVFFIFLILHLVQWFVSGRVHSYALRLRFTV